MSLDVCDAMTQGQLGYLIQKSIKNILNKKAVTIVTQVLVDKNDPAFKNPTKPIGPYYKTKIGKHMIKELEGWRKQGKEVFCYFDNDEAGYAARNALELQEMLG